MSTAHIKFLGQKQKPLLFTEIRVARVSAFFMPLPQAPVSTERFEEDKRTPTQQVIEPQEKSP